MARSYRVDYTKGISSVVDPHLLGDGYAVFVDNADLTAFAASSYRAPVFRLDVPIGTKHAFEYRGKWHLSDEHRNWAAEYIGKQERLYYTESGYTPGAGKPAMKVIDGKEARLGVARPACPLTVTSDVVASPGGFSVAVGPVGSALPDGSVTYRLGYRTVDGLIPAGEAITIALTKGQTAILTWGFPVIDGVTAVVIYGRTSGKEQILDEVTPDTVKFIDDGSMSPHGEYASNLDTSDVYYYFYTFLRTVNGHLDESGPSVRSGRIDQGKVNKITRMADLEGLFDGSTSVIGANAYKTPITHTVVGSKFRAVGDRRIITTGTDHGLTIGDEVGIRSVSDSVDPNVAKHVYTPTLFTTALATPTISDFGPGSTTAPVWAAGTVLRARVSAFRGTGWDETHIGSIAGACPAESLASAEVSWTTTAAKALLQWTYPTGDHDGFHVYINDSYVATVPAGTLFYEFNVVPGSAITYPTVDRSQSRVFFIPEDLSLVWDAGWATTYGLWGVMSTTIETKIVHTAHGLSEGALLSFYNYYELSGHHVVSRIGNADEFYLKVLTQTDDTVDLNGVRSYKESNPAYQYVTQWALYVQRGNTGGVALQQGIYPITQTEVIDYKPVQALSVTCDSSYLAATYEGDVLVEFDPWPLGVRNLTLHNNILWGILDNMVVWSPINRPDAQPKAFRRPFPFPPVAIEPYAGALVVLLPNGVGRFDGTDPANISFSMTDARDGCNAPNSVQHTAAGLMYLSPRGLMAFQAAINSSTPITDQKIEPSLFSGASGSDADHWPTWWLPTRSSAAWAKCTRGLPSADGSQGERRFDQTLLMRGTLEDVRSFYWRGRYYLYFTGNEFGNHGTIVVDTTRKNESGYPIFHMGLRPTHAHVTDRDQAFLLLSSSFNVLDLQKCQLSKTNDTTVLVAGASAGHYLAEMSPLEGDLVPFSIRTGPMSKPDPGLPKNYDAVEINGEGVAFVMVWIENRLVASGILHAQEAPKRTRRLRIPRGLGNGYGIDIFIAHQGTLTGYEVFYEVGGEG